MSPVKIFLLSSSFCAAANQDLFIYFMDFCQSTKSGSVDVVMCFFGCFLRLWSGSMTLGSFTCPHTHPLAPAFITHKSCWRSMRTSRSQQRYAWCAFGYLYSLEISLKLMTERCNKCICVVPSAVVLSGCLCSPVLQCEAHSQGAVLSSFLTAVSLLLCQSTSFCPLSNTLIPNSLSLPLSFTVMSTPLFLCGHYASLFSPSFNVPLLTANQRASKAVDPAGRWVLWQGARPCTGNKEMGVFCGQALPGLLSPHGQIPYLPGNCARHIIRLQQGCECRILMSAPVFSVLSLFSMLVYG